MPLVLGMYESRACSATESCGDYQSTISGVTCHGHLQAVPAQFGIVSIIPVWKQAFAAAAQ